MTVQANTLPPWMARARRNVGVFEIPGRGENPTVVAYFTKAGIPGRWTDDDAWCAAFVGAMIEYAGYRSTRSGMAKSYTRFVPCEMQIGAIGVIDRTNDPAFGHVFFIEKFDAHNVWPLGGNQRGKDHPTGEVTVGNPIPRHKVRTFLPPDYVAELEQPAPVVQAEREPISDPEPQPETWNDTEERLRDEGSRIVTRSDRIEKMAKRGGIFLVIAKIIEKVTEWWADAIEQLVPIFQTFKPVIAWAANNAPIIIAVILAFLVWEAIQLRNARVEDERKRKTKEA